MLRTSGDVSKAVATEDEGAAYAPHERRCFLPPSSSKASYSICSARAEMFPYLLPRPLDMRDMLRTSGDVSIPPIIPNLIKTYAPHERRCF